MKWFIDIEDCCGCSACYNVCPKNSIVMQQNAEGFLQPVCDDSSCIQCNMCKKVCPIINKQRTEIKPKSFVYQTPDDNVLTQSSSGGIFYTLSSHILKNNGIVFGARFDDHYNVVHDYIDNINDIYKLQGSKYVASDLGCTYKEAEEFLKEGKLVLFSGTPCQILGLLNYLRNRYSNLITVEIMCHGVPSSKIWQYYLQEIIEGEKIKKITFRSKKFGWDRYSLMIETHKRIKIHEPNDINVYMRGFIQSLYLRKSCYKCPARSFVTGSDIMIGDFWEARNIDKYNCNDGFSLIFLFTENANKFISQIDDLKLEEFSFDKVDTLGSHSTLFKSTYPHNGRKYFFENLEKNKKNISKHIEKSLRIKPKKKFSEKMVILLKYFFGTSYYRLRRIWKK